MANLKSRTSVVYEYFLELDDSFQCMVEDKENECRSRIPKLKTGSAASNLKRHLGRHHSDIAQKVDELEKETKSRKRKLDDSQRAISSFLPKAKRAATGFISENEFKLAILKMLAYDGVPLTFFQSEGFKMLNGSAAESLGISLGNAAIRSMLMEKAEEERKKLCDSLKGKLVSLKFDAATRLRQNFLGVNVQFWCEEDGLVVRTLAVVDTDADHSATHTRDLVTQVMTNFQLEKNQVLACVVDNAANMTKTVKLTNEEENQDEDDEVEEGFRVEEGDK